MQYIILSCTNYIFHAIYYTFMHELYISCIYYTVMHKQIYSTTDLDDVHAQSRNSGSCGHPGREHQHRNPRVSVPDHRAYEEARSPKVWAN